MLVVPVDGRTRTATRKTCVHSSERDEGVIILLSMRGFVGIDQARSSTSWHQIQLKVLVVVAQEAAVRARESLALAGPGLDSHLECHTRQPERLAH